MRPVGGMRLQILSEPDPVHGRLHPYVLQLLRRATTRTEAVKGPGFRHRSTEAAGARLLKRMHRKARAAGETAGFVAFVRAQAAAGNTHARGWLERKGRR